MAYRWRLLISPLKRPLFNIHQHSTVENTSSSQGKLTLASTLAHILMHTYMRTHAQVHAHSLKPFRGSFLFNSLKSKAPSPQNQSPVPLPLHVLLLPAFYPVLLLFPNYFYLFEGPAPTDQAEHSAGWNQGPGMLLLANKAAEAFDFLQEWPLTSWVSKGCVRVIRPVTTDPSWGNVILCHRPERLPIFEFTTSSGSPFCGTGQRCPPRRPA